MENRVHKITYSYLQPLARGLLVLTVLIVMAACGPRTQDTEPPTKTPSLDPGIATMPDGQRLPLSRWRALGEEPKAVILGVHGFNDYRSGWSVLGHDLRQRGVSVYAYDQRGFGATEHRGVWAGTEVLISDLAVMVDLLREQYPNTPLYIAGESMGGAVALLTHARHPELDIDGTILLAPAVWNRGAMPWYQRFALWAASRVAPERKLTGSGVQVRPSDNHDMLRALGRDPLIQRGARIDALTGLANLMDAAQSAIPHYRGRTLILYGEKDEIIPHRPTCQMFQRLPEAEQWRAALYREGYHMLTRDLQGGVVRQDIGDWVLNPNAALSSGEEAALAGRLGEFCGLSA